MKDKTSKLLALLLAAIFICGLYGFAGAARAPVTTLTQDQVQALVDARINELVPPMIEAAITPEPEPEPIPEPTPDPVIIPPDPEPEPAAPTYDAIVSGTDGAAIQAAINSISSGVVYVPPGDYRVETINLKSNITLTMYGARLYNPVSSPGKSMIWIGNGVTNAAILGGILEGPAATLGFAENYNTGITLWESPADITIKDVEIRYFQCDGIYIGCATTSDGAANGVLVEGCYIHHCGRNGISIISHRNATYRNNEMAFIGLNNTATSTGAGIKFEVNSSGGKNWVGENILVEGNNIHDCHIFGLMVSDYWDRVNPYHPVSITVQNNTVQNNATLGTATYTINANNCLEFTTYTDSRWVKWDGVTYNSGLKTW